MKNHGEYFNPLQISSIELQTIDEKNMIHEFDKTTFEIDVKNLQLRKNLSEIR